MKSEEKIRSLIALYTAYEHRERAEALNACDVDVAATHLRKLYDWRIRAETLRDVLRDE
jgi:hypothetical protein